MRNTIANIAWILSTKFRFDQNLIIIEKSLMTNSLLFYEKKKKKQQNHEKRIIFYEVQAFNTQTTISKRETKISRAGNKHIPLPIPISSIDIRSCHSIPSLSLSRCLSASCVLASFHEEWEATTQRSRRWSKESEYPRLNKNHGLLFLLFIALILLFRWK